MFLSNFKTFKMIIIENWKYSPLGPDCISLEKCFSPGPYLQQQFPRTFKVARFRFYPLYIFFYYFRDILLVSILEWLMLLNVKNCLLGPKNLNSMFWMSFKCITYYSWWLVMIIYQIANYNINISLYLCNRILKANTCNELSYTYSPVPN